MTWKYRQLHADLETPVSAYLKLRGAAAWSFLYESVEGPESWADYSIIGIGALNSYVISGEPHGGDMPDPIDQLRSAWDSKGGVRPEANSDFPSFIGGIFGFLSYDSVRCFEPTQRVERDLEVPDACFFEPELLAVFDNRRHGLRLYSLSESVLDDAVARLAGPLPPHPGPGRPDKPVALTPDEDFEAQVTKVKEHIVAGDVFQLVLSRRFSLPRVADPFDVYRGLRHINPSPYLFFFDCPSVTLAGASPEVMVRVDDGEVIVRPIAGTRPRGKTQEQDRALEAELMNDPKELAEHIMLVDLGRNDVGRVSTPGGVKVTDFKVVERYSHVMHIVSEVRGKLSEEQDSFSALRAAFPAGTLSGAPKVRAMQIIDELEPSRRGVYGGAVGYFGPNGNADFGIAIRTLAATEDCFIIQAGAGVVADSDPLSERKETEHKAEAVLRAIEWAASPAAVW